MFIGLRRLSHDSLRDSSDLSPAYRVLERLWKVVGLKLKSTGMVSLESMCILDFARFKFRDNTHHFLEASTVDSSPAH